MLEQDGKQKETSKEQVNVLDEEKIKQYIAAAVIGGIAFIAMMVVLGIGVRLFRIVSGV